MGLLEVACFTPESALIAANAGADRIELCQEQHLGGTTPPFAWLERVKKEASATVPVYVMIRPRGGDFNYNADEFARMQAEIDRFKTLDADGFVFGILDAQGSRIEFAKTAELVRRASPLPCTFHRAFDNVGDLAQALEDVISTGCSTVLTSGGEATAFEGLKCLGSLVTRAAGRIIVMPGGGVRASNLPALRGTGAQIYHSSAVVQDTSTASATEIRLMKKLLQSTLPSDAE